jgi:bifunctional non-homologous end joining protein LigD
MTASSSTPAAWAPACQSRSSRTSGAADPLARKTSPLSLPPPGSTRFGSPLVLSRVHWVEPKLVAEITYLTWTADDLLRHTVYVGLREDKPADQVRREAARAR